MMADSRHQRNRTSLDRQKKYANGEAKFGWGPVSNYRPNGGGIKELYKKRVVSGV